MCARCFTSIGPVAVLRPASPPCGPEFRAQQSLGLRTALGMITLSDSERLPAVIVGYRTPLALLWHAMRAARINVPSTWSRHAVCSPLPTCSMTPSFRVCVPDSTPGSTGWYSSPGCINAVPIPGRCEALHKYELRRKHSLHRSHRVAALYF